MKVLVLKSNNKIFRVFHCYTDLICLGYNRKTGRLDIFHSQSSQLKNKTIKILKKINLSELKNKKISFLQNHSLELVNKVEGNLFTRPPRTEEDLKPFWAALGMGLSLFLFFITSFIWFYDEQGESSQESIEPQIVKVVKPIPLVQPKKVVVSHQSKKIQQKASPPVEQKKPKKVLKKLGVLAALGELSTQKEAGLNLGASQVSRGPGLKALSSTSGSGGVQSSIYSEGMLVAALGSGGNIKGGGGYGTKGTSAGGGAKGYGQITLIGSGGARDLSHSSSFDFQGSGFDTSLISQEIVKHLGKIRNCYDEILKHEPGLRGVFVSQFLIGQTGKVISAKRHQDSEVKSVSFSECILKIISQIHFDFQVPQGVIRIVYPFDLATLGA